MMHFYSGAMMYFCSGVDTGDESARISLKQQLPVVEEYRFLDGTGADTPDCPSHHAILARQL